MNGASRVRALDVCASVALGRFVRAYWTTMRPYLLPVSGAVGLAGLATARDLDAKRVLVGAVAFSAAYGFGQALTDVSQIDTDAISAPYRPLVRGVLRRADVLAVSLAGLAVCSLVLVALNPWTLLLASLAVGGVATYTPMKRRFWAGPGHNSWIVALLPAMGALCDGRSPSVVLGNPIVWALMGSTFFSYATFVLLGYLKDVEADWATGYRTLPVRFGRRVTVAVSGACIPPALASSGAVVRAGSQASGFAWGVGAAVWTVGAVLLVLSHVRALDATRDERAHPAISMCVRGYVALHLGEAVVLRPALCLPALVLYACFEIALAERPCKEQV
jgi:geranylgeranylglycerol-phosphate geranylgeranyltransferase